MTSPKLEQAANSTRTESEVRALRNKTIRMTRPNTKVIRREQDLPPAQQTRALDVIARNEGDRRLTHRRCLLPCHCTRN